MSQNYGKWVPKYYDDYQDKMAKAGLEALDGNAWAKKYYGIDEAFREDGSVKWQDRKMEWGKVKSYWDGHEGVNLSDGQKAWDKEATAAVIDKYNTYAQDNVRAAGGTYIAYDGSDNFDDAYKAMTGMKSSRDFNWGEAYNRYAADAKAKGAEAVSIEEWKPGTAVVIPEELKYEFVMPEEWQTIEDMANKRVAGGEPSLSPESITGFENKLESAYAPVRENLKESMADYWASLFPQGGGSGTQAKMNMDQLNNFELDKFNRALDMANTDLATKLSLYNQAQTQLSDIGQFKAASDQFKSQQDAANYWSSIATKWDQSKYFNDILQAQKSWNQESELAKYLAQISKPKEANPWDTALNSAITGIATYGTKALMASSRDFKDDIQDSTIDSLSMIKDLDIKTYRYKGEDKQRIGVIAEEVPELMNGDPTKKSLDVVNLFGLLLDAVQKLTLKVEQLEASRG